MLDRAMSSVRAWELLNDPNYCGRLNMSEFHKLLLRAGYLEATAAEAARQRGWDRLGSGEVM